jgi:glycosyltransferase involved in cell wall biosynthesis
MKKRVLVFNHFAIPMTSPGSSRHVQIFPLLQGWSWCIVAADRNLSTRRRQRGDGVTFRTVPTTPFSASYVSRVVNWCSYAVGALFVGLVDRPRPTIVYGSSPHLLAGLAAWAVARLRRARFILEVRDIWPLILVEMGALSPRSRTFAALSRLERFLYLRADAIVVLAEGSIERLKECGVDRSKVNFIPNGADPSWFVPRTRREEVRRRYSLTGFIFVYAGAHGEANGLEAVLDAADDVKVDLPDVRFLLVGGGPVKSGLVRRADREGLDNVVFLGPIPKEEIPDILGAADVGLHVLADVPLFRYGVSPNKVNDYMAAGLPVLTNTPGEVTGLVVQAGAGVGVEPHELADGVRRMHALGSDELARWGLSGKRFIEEERSPRVLAKRLEDVLNDVAGGAGRH